MSAGRGHAASFAALISLKDTSVVCHRIELRKKKSIQVGLRHLSLPDAISSPNLPLTSSEGPVSF